MFVLWQGVRMNRFLVFVACCVGCTTSSVPSTGFDGGFDAPAFDAPRFDVPRPDVFSFPDAGPRDAGPPPFDGGPPPFDGGPIIVDAGSDAFGPPMCATNGTYDLVSLPGNPSLCSIVGSSCVVSRRGSASALAVTCNGSRLECELEGECDCRGTTQVAGFGVSVDISFLRQVARFSGQGVVCSFGIALR